VKIPTLFYDLRISGVSRAATDATITMTELWKVEDEVRGKDAGSRAALRQEKSAAIVAALFDLWEKELRKTSGKSKAAEAIRYALTRRARRWSGSLRMAASRSPPTSSNGRSDPGQSREKLGNFPEVTVVHAPGRHWPLFSRSAKSTASIRSPGCPRP
jgi:hypothetical protein